MARKTRSTQDLRKAYDAGDVLTDVELSRLHDALLEVFNATHTFGDRYKLVADDAWITAMRLREYARARGIESKLATRAN